MVSQNKIAQVIDSFFDANHLDATFREIIIVALRDDGVLLYSNQSEDGLQAVGALMSGAWQAAHALMNIVPDYEVSQDVLRFSFDTASSGVYILPLDLGVKKIFLGMIFKEELNPAFLKNKMRGLTQELSEFFISHEEMYDVEKEVKKEMSKKDNFLFSEISDEEIDNLFSFNGE